jgi:hypothetical protein
MVVDTVRGLVFDSITNAPIADAFVVAEPGGALTATTREGRFILVSPARIRKISVFHDVTADLGLSGLVALRPDPSQPWNDVMVATPSMSTLWTKHCNGRVPVPGMAGILMGSARASRDSTPIVAAQVLVQWKADAKGSPLDSARGVSDDQGDFIVCGVRETGETRVTASLEGIRPVSVVVPPSVRSLRRVELVLGGKRHTP